MYFVRFTNETLTPQSVSYDGFKNEPFDGVCAFDITELIEEECRFDFVNAARKAAEKDSTYAKNNDGMFKVFLGHKVHENPYGNGVIVKPGEILFEGQLVWSDRANTWQIV
jgi:hypothetical protein